MEDSPSERILDQRIRNRVIENLETLAAGDAGVREVGAKDYFENFYDWIPHHDDGGMPSNRAVTEAEQELLEKVRAVLDDACDATPKGVSTDELISSGWPARVQPAAHAALRSMLARGRFDEHREEQEPTSPPPAP